MKLVDADAASPAAVRLSPARLPGWGAAERCTARAPEKSPPARLEPVAAVRSATAADGWTIVGGRQRTSSRALSRAPAAAAALPSQPSEREHVQPASCGTCCAADAASLAPQAAARISGDDNQSFARSSRAASLLQQAVREVAAAGVVETLASVLQGAWSAPVHRLVLLGLGSPTSSATSRYQLALGLLLGPAVGLAGAPLLFDPAFDVEDLELLAQHQCCVLSADEAAKVHATPDGMRTLFFMPHCEEHLYAAVLAANVERRALSHIAILGNSFSEYAERASLRQASAGGPRASLVTKLQPVAQEFPVTISASCGFPPSAFNSLALHLFPGAACHAALDAAT